MNAPVGCLNGKVVPQTELALSFADAGFVSGATVTDACRTFGHRLFRWPDHLRRFRRDCDACRIPLPHSDADLTAWAEEVVAANARLLAGGDDLTLITCATPGPLARFGDVPGVGTPTLLMHTYPLARDRYRPLFTRGAWLRVAGFVPLAEGSLLDPRVKHRSRLHWWLAEQRFREQGHADCLPLLLDGPQGNVTETSIASFLIVRDRTVFSAPAGQILDAISLRVTREICAEAEIPFAERPLTLQECLTADEAIVTGTSFGLAGVSRIDDAPLPWPGPVTERLREGWNARAGLDIAGQFVG